LTGTTVAIAAILFAATLIRSTFGFGEALIAVPLLALLLPVKVAAPVAVLVSVTVALIIVLQDWRHIHLRSAGGLVLATLPGIPLGLLLLKNVAEPLIKSVLAILIIAFSARALFGGKERELKNDRFAFLFGFFAGVLGGAYGMNGPPLVIYGSLRRWSPQHFRATLQAYFLPASLLGFAGYWSTGLWTPTVTRLYLVALPFVLLATLLGRAINRRFSGRRFLMYVHGALIAVGFVLLVQAAI
jgi:uncharacterized membrane protein YfcA